MTQIREDFMMDNDKIKRIAKMVLSEDTGWVNKKDFPRPPASWGSDVHETELGWGRGKEPIKHHHPLERAFMPRQEREELEKKEKSGEIPKYYDYVKKDLDGNPYHPEAYKYLKPQEIDEIIGRTNFKVKNGIVDCPYCHSGQNDHRYTKPTANGKHKCQKCTHEFDPYYTDLNYAVGREKRKREDEETFRHYLPKG
jgi:hypothetical protein